MNDTRSRLLDTACELFARDGFDITMEAIRLKAGVSSGSLHHFFRNHEALACALFKQLHEASIERRTNAIGNHVGKPTAGLIALQRGEVAFAAERPAQARVHQMLAAMVWSKKMVPSVATWRAEQDEQFRRSLESLIGTNPGPGAALSALVMAIEGCASRLLAGDLGGVPAVDMDKITGDIGAALCKGFGIPLKVATRPDQTERSRKASRQPDFFC